MERFEVTGENEISVKRFYLPLVIDVKCPKCQSIQKLDFNDSYLSYPTVNKPNRTDVHCKACDDYFDVNIILRIAIELET